MSLFTLKKNAHYCSPRLGFLGFKKFDIGTAGRMEGTFRLMKNMWYDTSRYGTHINKLCGFSTDIFSEGSIRIGWRPHQEPWLFEMYAYLHIGGQWVRSTRLKDDLINVCYCDVDYAWELPIPVGEVARLTVGANTVERHYPMPLGAGWVQEFYYGGKPKAMQEMSCIINGNEYEF